MREVRNDGRKLINMDINFVHEGKNKNDTMKENNEVNQLWIERSGRDSWRRWYLSQDWRRGKKINQVTWIRAFQREHQGLEPWKGDNEPCSVGDGGSWVIVLEKKARTKSWGPGSRDFILSGHGNHSRMETIQIIFLKDLSGHCAPGRFNKDKNEGRKPTEEGTLQ